MSEENRASFRRFAEAFSEQDLDRMAPELDPACELYPLRAQIESKAYVGLDGVAELIADLAEDWENLRVEIDELLDHGHLVVALCRLHGRGRSSGVDLDVPMGFVSRYRDGRMVYSRSYSEQADALRAAGLDQLRPPLPPDPA